MTPTLDIAGLSTHFFTRDGIAKAVDGVSFSIAPGKVLGLVGESGSGKSVTGFSILGLVDPPGRIVAGAIRFKGENLVGADTQRLRSLRGNRIAMVFQDPMMTLNPVLRIGEQMAEAIAAHSKATKSQTAAQARDALGAVGIASPEERLAAYPHHLSGGMRQRVAIAIALINAPDLLIADEPTTALDVTIQGQILSVVQRLVARSHTALLWITHDLSVVAGLADRIAVMYAGRIVEQAAVDDLLTRPRHPYTAGLLASLPERAVHGGRLASIPGMAPSLLNRPQGCAFRARCGLAHPECGGATIPERQEDDRRFACLHPLSDQPRQVM